jgi:integrase
MQARTAVGRDFEVRRDAALIRVLLDAGPRRAEAAAMRVEDVDFDSVVWVRGKGGRFVHWRTNRARRKQR